MGLASHILGAIPTTLAGKPRESKMYQNLLSVYTRLSIGIAGWTVDLVMKDQGLGIADFLGGTPWADKLRLLAKEAWRRISPKEKQTWMPVAVPKFDFLEHISPILFE